MSEMFDVMMNSIDAHLKLVRNIEFYCKPKGIEPSVPEFLVDYLTP